MINRAVMIAGALTALVSAVLFLGCGDDPGRRTVAKCAVGQRIVWAMDVRGELVCEDNEGTAFASRGLRKDETPESACAFCLGRPQ